MSESRDPPLTELYVVGPSSTGKTTLCNALARSLDLPMWCYISEVARHVMKATGYTREHVGTIEMQRAIMLAQIREETQASTRAQTAERGHPLLLCDRSGVDPIVYAVLTAKDKHEARRKKDLLLNEPTFQQTLPRYRNARFLLLNPVPEWRVDDGVRSLEQHERCIVVFREVLTELGIPFSELGEEMKDLGERVEWVKRAVVASTRSSPRL